MNNNQPSASFLAMAIVLFNLVKETFSDDRNGESNPRENYYPFFSDFSDLHPASKAVVIGLLVYMASLLACVFSCSHMRIKREDKEARENPPNDKRNRLQRFI